MIQVTESIVIRRPVEEVFAYVSDPKHAPEWQSALLEVRQTTAGPLGVGTQFIGVRKFLGRKIESSAEIVAYEPETSVTYKSDAGPMPMTWWYRFEPVSEGVSVTCEMEMRPGALFGLAEPIIAGGVKRELVASFGDLKDLLENRAVAISS
jgi:uncharacterized protein YndB with AHSA1/START domain